jgi:hypothetical protein
MPATAQSTVRLGWGWVSAMAGERRCQIDEVGYVVEAARPPPRPPRVVRRRRRSSLRRATAALGHSSTYAIHYCSLTSSIALCSDHTSSTPSTPLRVHLVSSIVMALSTTPGLTSHVQQSRLEACWREQNCSSCLRSSQGCGWCAQVRLESSRASRYRYHRHLMCGAVVVRKRGIDSLATNTHRHRQASVDIDPSPSYHH